MATPPAEPPSVEHLDALSGAAWTTVVEAVREALNAVERPPPRLRRLRAVPDQRLQRGRSRRELVAVLTEDEDLWNEVRRRLESAQGGSVVLDLLAGEEPPRLADEEDDREVERLRRRVESLGSDVEGLRARNRDLVGERDEARRRADGLAARRETERARIDEQVARRRRAEEARDELERRLSEAEDERRRSEDRIRRRHEAEREEMREELRRLRRETQERERLRSRREREREEAERRARAEIEAFRTGSGASAPASAARPGRPHRLPAGIAPGTADALRAVLAAGPIVLVDGYNVTKQHRGDVALPQQRDWLLALSQRIDARTPARLTLVYDGQETIGATSSTSSGRGVRTAFARGRSADDEIVGLVAAAPSDRPLVVVTDDGELADRVRAHDADVFGTDVLVDVAGR